ncbi:TraE/TraK family type IV conjugative transfer system protein [Burkholderia multivorans]|nr:TraE/TraK family type IV conjugative transfer system protein [Burkholderia multivorans]MDN8102582.1 TraE/TraK family type IV conjugative transfer system protein [Burkholderia multivorans]
MDLANRHKSVAELRRDKDRLIWTVLALAIGIAVLAAKVAFMSEIIVNRVPGTPDGAKIERNGMDVGAQQAIVFAVSNALASVNPSNGDSIKRFVQPFLSPAAYTKVSLAIDNKVAQLAAEHELGSYYLVVRRFEADEKLGRVFVLGDLHTVNAARDTAEPWVFEYPVHFSNYQMILDDVVSYKGDKAHNSDWIKAQQKK